MQITIVSVDGLIQCKKQRKGDSNIQGWTITKKEKSFDVFNSCFQSITDSLDLFEWSLWSADQIYHSVDRVISSFRFHFSIKNIKRNYKITSKFSFKSVSEEFVKRHCKRFIFKQNRNSTENLEKMCFFFLFSYKPY